MKSVKRQKAGGKQQPRGLCAGKNAEKIGRMTAHFVAKQTP
jgi:hypothetical protein